MEAEVREILSDLSLGEIRYFDRIGSTNEEALHWAARGALDLSLVLANEQTRGRGRLDRTWFTTRDAALAFSLILRPTHNERAHPSQLTGLLALSLIEILLPMGLPAAIKWPNDVLVNEKKLAGILVESSWTGDKPDAFVLGMGVNVTPEAIPRMERLLFPATSIESELGRTVGRAQLFRDILQRFLSLRPTIGTGGFIQTWEKHLAYMGQQVKVDTGKGKPFQGVIQGLDADGGLRLEIDQNRTITAKFGNVHLRQVT
jgi:BirA family biotin operon repressor/biotin-[acetyl-CoA-carboxylase] ligase